MTGVIAGAIRWDAWYVSTSSLFGNSITISLDQWQFRAPWFCNTYSGLIDTNGDRQLIIDLEIQYAATAGLKYFAFDIAGIGTRLSTGWGFYQSSAYKSQINWCWVVTSDGYFGSTGNYSSHNATFVAQFQQSNYQLVLGNRPLMYLFFSTFPNFGSSTSNFAAALADLRSQAIAAGLGSPYIVLMSGTGNLASLGADAISGYIAVPGSSTGQPYASLSSYAAGVWASQASSGSPMIPTVQMGWDNRPRINNPPPWEPSPGVSWFYPGTVNERADHLQAAVNFVKAHPSACPSSALIIYSWNECDEGGGSLIPTIGDPPTGPPPALNGILSKLQPILQAA
jgi:hypothetical protein